MKITVEGKTVEDAKNEAMKKLGIFDEKMIEFNVVEEESRGIFGFGSKNAKIEASVKNPGFFYAREYITGLLEKMNVGHFSLECAEEGKEIEINIRVPLDIKSRLIGKFGQTLNSMEYLAKIYVNSKLNEEEARKFSLHLDVEGYRKEKIDKIMEIAVRLAEKVKETGKSLEMKPMSARERKAIHMSFRNDPQISTFSKGQEPYRKVIISTRKNEVSK